MTFADQLSITFLVALALAALMFVATPLVPGLITAFGHNIVVASSVGSALVAVGSMLGAVLALQR